MGPIVHCHRRRQCCRHHTLALASTVTIAAAFANVIAPPTLLSMVGCYVICRPSPAALSAVQICQPPLSCSASLTLFLLGRRPLLLTIASRCLSLFYRASIAFAAPVAGWLLRSPPVQQHNNHITKLKTFPVSTSWTYFDLLRVSTCKRMKNLRGCQFSLSSYDLISNDSYIHEGKCVGDIIPGHDFVGKKKADLRECH
jgi:hypothetical protein